MDISAKAIAEGNVMGCFLVHEMMACMAEANRSTSPKNLALAELKISSVLKAEE